MTLPEKIDATIHLQNHLHSLSDAMVKLTRRGRILSYLIFVNSLIASLLYIEQMQMLRSVLKINTVDRFTNGPAILIQHDSDDASKRKREGNERKERVDWRSRMQNEQVSGQV